MQVEFLPCDKDILKANQGAKSSLLRAASIKAILRMMYGMLHPYINSEDVYDPTSVLAGEIGASPFLINARIIYCNLEEILLPLILKRNLLQKPKDRITH